MAQRAQRGQRRHAAQAVARQAQVRLRGGAGGRRHELGAALLQPPEWASGPGCRLQGACRAAGRFTLLAILALTSCASWLIWCGRPCWMHPLVSPQRCTSRRRRPARWQTDNGSTPPGRRQPTSRSSRRAGSGAGAAGAAGSGAEPLRSSSSRVSCWQAQRSAGSRSTRQSTCHRQRGGATEGSWADEAKPRELPGSRRRVCAHAGAGACLGRQPRAPQRLAGAAQWGTLPRGQHHALVLLAAARRPPAAPAGCAGSAGQAPGSAPRTASWTPPAARSAGGAAPPARLQGAERSAGARTVRGWSGPCRGAHALTAGAQPVATRHASRRGASPGWKSKREGVGGAR